VDSRYRSCSLRVGRFGGHYYLLSPAAQAGYSAPAGVRHVQHRLAIKALDVRVEVDAIHARLRRMEQRADVSVNGAIGVDVTADDLELLTALPLQPHQSPFSEYLGRFISTH